MRQLNIESQTYRDKSTVCSCTNLLCSDDVKIYFYYNYDCGCFDKRTSTYLFGADMRYASYSLDVPFEGTVEILVCD